MINKIVKKMLVSYNPKKPESRGGDFVIPLFFNEKVSFFSIKSGKPVRYGLMVFTGKGITIDDILSKVRFPDVMNEQNIQPLIDFINNISDFKIGDVIEIDDNGKLKVVPKSAGLPVSKLP